MAKGLEIEPWIYKGNSVNDDIYKDYEGFVYIMTHKPTGKKYIGKKSFWSSRKLKSSDKRKTKVESNWKRYFSSSDDIKHLTKGDERANWTREIVFLCKEMKYANYLEVKLQFQLGVLESDGWFNSNINGLWYSHWLKGIEQSVDGYEIKRP